MSDKPTPEDQEKEIQTQHVFNVAKQNLALVIDQLESLHDTRTEIVLEALDTAKNDLDKLIGI